MQWYWNVLSSPSAVYSIDIYFVTNCWIVCKLWKLWKTFLHANNMYVNSHVICNINFTPSHSAPFPLFHFLLLVYFFFFSHAFIVFIYVLYTKPIDRKSCARISFLLSFFNFFSALVDFASKTIFFLCHSLFRWNWCVYMCLCKCVFPWNIICSFPMSFRCSHLTSCAKNQPNDRNSTSRTKWKQQKQSTTTKI